MKRRQPRSIKAGVERAAKRDGTSMSQMIATAVAEKAMAHAECEFEDSSGNVFADFGLPDADDLATKEGLIGSIMRYQQEHGLSQSALALLVDIPQPRLSILFAGKMHGITSEKLIKACTKLGRHVRIVIEVHPADSAAGRVALEVA